LRRPISINKPLDKGNIERFLWHLGEMNLFGSPHISLLIVIENYRLL
jgi:hypothetical protein